MGFSAPRARWTLQSQVGTHHSAFQSRMVDSQHSGMPWKSVVCTSGSLGLMGVAKKANARKKVAAKAGFDPTSSVGVLDTLGYWDPLGFMKKENENDYYGTEWKDEADFNYYRAAELKHGR